MQPRAPRQLVMAGAFALVVAMSLAAAGPEYSAAAMADEIRSLLPAREGSVDLMTTSLNQRVADLGGRMERAAQNNREWLLAYVRDHADTKGPLPYHPNFGVTEDQYREVLANTPALSRLAAVRLQIVEPSPGVISFTGDPEVFDLSRLELRIRDLSLQTPFGVIKGPEVVKVDGTGGLMGSHSGFRWSLEEGTAESANLTVVSLLLGRQSASGKHFLHYRAGQVVNGRSTADVNVIILFDPPKH